MTNKAIKHLLFAAGISASLAIISPQALAKAYYVDGNLGLGRFASANHFGFGLGFGIKHSLSSNLHWGGEINYHSYGKENDNRLNSVDFLGVFGVRVAPRVHANAKFGFNWLFYGSDKPVHPEVAGQIAYSFAPYFSLTAGISHTFSYLDGITYFSTGLQYSF